MDAPVYIIGYGESIREGSAPSIHYFNKFRRLKVNARILTPQIRSIVSKCVRTLRFSVLEKNSCDAKSKWNIKE
jgi:hypothetical protein